MSFEGCHLFFFVVFAFEMNIKAEAFSGGCLASAMARLVVPENDSQVPPRWELGCPGSFRRLGCVEPSEVKTGRRRHLLPPRVGTLAIIALEISKSRRSSSLISMADRFSLVVLLLLLLPASGSLGTHRDPAAPPSIPAPLTDRETSHFKPKPTRESRMSGFHKGLG